MTFKIVEKQPKKLSAFGSLARITKRSRKDLSNFHLYSQHQILAKEWLALYWDNPETNPPAELRADISLSVTDDYVLPAQLSDQLAVQEILAVCTRCITPA